MILAIETTGPLASVAVMDAQGRIRQEQNDTRYSHLEELVPMVSRLMEAAGIGADDLRAIAVSRGPGSFTGIRIGMVTAKALGLVWDKPLVAVPTLESFTRSREGEEAHLVVPVLDARRNQIYAAAYRREAGGFRPVLEEGARDLEDFLRSLDQIQEEKEEALFFGDGIPCLEEGLAAYEKAWRLAEGEERFQQAASVVRLGAQLLAQGCQTDAFAIAPNYLRLSEAERKWRKGG